MTRNEAIERLVFLKGVYSVDTETALDMAIEALSAEAVTHGRLIDADALSKKVCETTIFIKDGDVFQRMINDAPTVSAEAVQGEWGHMIADGSDGSHWYEYECSHCGEIVLRPYNFCPNCGAEMTKGGDTE